MVNTMETGPVLTGHQPIRARIMLWTVAWLAAIAVAGPAGASAMDATHLRLTLSDRWAVVAVRLGDDPRAFRFIVDTAAGATVVDEAVASQLGLPRAHEGPARIQGASGKAQTYASATVAMLHLGHLDIPAVDVVVLDMAPFASRGQHYDGILGRDVLGRFGMVFDVPGGDLGLIASDAPPAAMDDCLEAPPGVRPSGFGVFDATLPSGRGARIVIDSGAASTFLNWSAAAAIGIDRKSDRLRPGIAGTAGTAGVDPMARTQTWFADVPGLTIAGWTTQSFEANISRLPLFAGFGLEDRPAVIVGINLLRERAFYLAPGARRLCFARASR